MGKVSKIISGIFMALSLVCFALFFVFSQDKTYVVKFDTNGGNNIDSQEVKENELAIKPVDPTKEGYTFIEWQLNGAKYDFQTAVTSDLTINALWQKVYTVSVKLDDKDYSTIVNENEKLELSKLNIPEQEGYDIKIYNADDTEYDMNSSVMSDLSLKASYVALNKYTVKFNTNGASRLDNVEVYEGKLLKEPTVSREGYVLQGWYLDDELYDFSKPVEKDMLLKAKWIEKDKLVVTFNVDGTQYLTKSVKENSKVTQPENPTKKNYVFTEWQLNGKTYNFSDPVTSNITLEAVFREAKTFTVTFDSDGGSKVSEKIVVEGTKLTKPTDPTKSGYTFDGWMLDGKVYNFSEVVTKDLKLKAKWEEDALQYTVSFNSNGGSFVSSQKVKENGTAKVPTNPERSGYRFIRWIYNNTGYDFNTPVTKDITLFAEWQALEQYTVTFDGGSSVAAQKLASGEKVVEVANPTKEGYSFVEWQLNGTKYNFNTPVTSSIKLVALWKKN